MAEEDPWAFDEGDTAETTTTAGGDAAAPAAEGGDAAAPSDAPAEEAAPPPPPEDDGYRKPVQLYRHWVRPKFLQYRYMYNYRTNYYDDVIDYLDKKQKGVSRDVPRAQTWAERVLRTSVGSRRYSYFDSSLSSSLSKSTLSSLSQTTSSSLSQSSSSSMSKTSSSSYSSSATSASSSLQNGAKTEEYWNPSYDPWSESPYYNGRSLDHYGGRHHDTHLIQVLAASIKTHNYHTTAYMNQKYSRVL